MAEMRKSLSTSEVPSDRATTFREASSSLGELNRAALGELTLNCARLLCQIGREQLPFQG